MTVLGPLAIRGGSGVVDTNVDVIVGDAFRIKRLTMPALMLAQWEGPVVGEPEVRLPSGRAQSPTPPRRRSVGRVLGEPGEVPADSWYRCSGGARRSRSPVSWGRRQYVDTAPPDRTRAVTSSSTASRGARRTARPVPVPPRRPSAASDPAPVQRAPSGRAPRRSTRPARPRADLPNTSLTTQSSLIPASSTTFCSRWTSRVRS
jgi:hypothetical protein